MFNNFDLFGIKQEMIDWEKTAKSDFEGSINIEVHSNKLVIDPRLSKNTLVCIICTLYHKNKYCIYTIILSRSLK